LQQDIYHQPGNVKKAGSFLLASNHPNSFLDAIILDVLFKKSIWSLTRGDVFKHKFISGTLPALKNVSSISR
jgi:1-acyl-sn-glycerol-3-phosphate acyltransferase